MRIYFEYREENDMPKGVLIRNKAKSGTSVDYDLNNNDNSVLIKISGESEVVNYIDTSVLKGYIVAISGNSVFVVDLEKCSSDNTSNNIAIIGSSIIGEAGMETVDVIGSITGYISYVNYDNSTLYYDRKLTELVNKHFNGSYILSSEKSLFVVKNNKIIMCFDKQRLCIKVLCEPELKFNENNIIFAKNGKDSYWEQCERYDIDTNNAITRMMYMILFIEDARVGNCRDISTLNIPQKDSKDYFQAFVDDTYIYLFSKFADSIGDVESVILPISTNPYETYLFSSKYVKETIEFFNK